MLPLYEDSHFTFRFADDRLIPRFRLEGVPGRRVAVYRLDPATGGRGERIAEAVCGDDGWVELAGPIVVRADEGFVAVPEDGGPASSPCQAPPGWWEG